MSEPAGDDTPDVNAAVDLAFHTIHYSPRFGSAVPLGELLDAAVAAGFVNVGLDRASIAGVDGPGREGAAREYERRRLRCSDLVALVLSGDVDRDRALAAELAEDAAATGAACCVAAAPERLPSADLLRTAAACAEVLDGAGVRMAVEYGAYFGVRSLAEASAICEELGWERAGLAVDSWQFARAGSTWDELATLRGDQLALVQYADTLASPSDDVVTESRTGRLVPGRGAFDRARFVDTVLATGYRGPVVAEVLSATARASDPWVFTKQVADAMRRDWTAADR